MISSLIWNLERLTGIILAIILLTIFGIGLFNYGIIDTVYLLSQDLKLSSGSYIYVFSLTIILIHIFLGIRSIMEDYIQDSIIFTILGIITILLSLKILI